MKYPQFFAILADQCSRFAADAEVPEYAGQLLDELRSQTALADADEPLRQALKELLTPLYTRALEQSRSVAGDMIATHVSALKQQRAATEAEFEAQRLAAVEKEQAFLRENEAAKATLLDLRAKYEALEARLARVEPPQAPAAEPPTVSK